MKRKILLLVLFLGMLVLPIKSFAKTYYEDYKTLDLVGTLGEEEIELINKEYTETDDQAVIYLFRGKGCHYCQGFLNFINSLTVEYGKYFKVVSFESWYDVANGELLETISEYLEQPAGGVPYIIIGEHVFGGYAEDFNEEIKAAIMEEYENKNANDVFVKYEKHLKSEKIKAFFKAILPIIYSLVIVGIATFFISRHYNKQINLLNDKINKLEKKLVNNDTHKDTKPVTKTKKK